ncbi:unnamed protein product [Schistosoma rodhaini]|nr:unnamed protein product [Schistosoma rodhaini]
MFRSAFDEFLFCIFAFRVLLSHKHCQQRWTVFSIGVQDARFILFRICHPDVPASQSSCSFWDSTSLPFSLSLLEMKITYERRLCDIAFHLIVPPG